jgi:hypothetical protein
MARTKWTVLTYIAAHNDLAQFGATSRNEIVQVGSSDDVVHGVLYDRPDGAARYVIGEPGYVTEQETLTAFNSGDPEALIQTAAWLFAKYPAERYGLVLWSHGTGWAPAEVAAVAGEARPGANDTAVESHERAAAPGSLVLFRSTLRALQTPPAVSERAILFDDGSGQSLDTLELARVTRTIAERIGKPIECLGMDACLMASLEVAYQLRDSVNCLVASEELVPAHSWPYARIYALLAAAPDQDGRAFAKAVVEQYVQFYTATPPAAGDVTKVAIDLRELGTLGRTTRVLANTLAAEMQHSANALWEVQHAAMQQETTSGKRKPNKFQYYLWDLGSITRRLAAAPLVSAALRGAAQALTDALAPGGAVLAEGHWGAWFDGTAGVTVYLMPPGQQRLSPYYSQLAFAQDAGWHAVLTAYHEQLG